MGETNQYYEKSMYWQENALDTTWWYASLKTFAGSCLVASMLSLACFFLYARGCITIGIASCCFFILPGIGKQDLQRGLGFFCHSFGYLFSMKGLCQCSCGFLVDFQCVVAEPGEIQHLCCHAAVLSLGSHLSELLLLCHVTLSFFPLLKQNVSSSSHGLRVKVWNKSICAASLSNSNDE